MLQLSNEFMRTSNTTKGKWSSTWAARNEPNLFGRIKSASLLSNTFCAISQCQWFLSALQATWRRTGPELSPMVLNAQCVWWNLALMSAILKVVFVTMITCEQTSRVFADLQHLRSLAKNNTEFALQFYTTLKNNAPNQNLVFSPVGLSLSMLMLHLGANGDTQEQISAVFHFSKETENLYETYKELQTRFNHPLNNYTLDIHNKMYGKTGYRYREAFMNDSRNYFDASLEEVDFTNQADDVGCRINTWVANVTSQRINHLLHASFLTSSSVLFMLNVMYFNGVWKHPFDYHETTKGNFHITRTKVVEMEMMKTKKYLRYADMSERYRFRILEIPYVGEKSSLFILLPDPMSGLGYVETHLTNVDFEDVIHNKMKKYQVDVSIPRFQIRQHLNLRAILSQMGITNLFLSGSADLSGIAENADIYLTEFMHSIFLQVNEVGTEAVSTSGFKVGLTSLVQNPEFIVDRPFLFIIRDKVTGVILFMGRLVKPPDYVAQVGIFADGRFDRNAGCHPGQCSLVVIPAIITWFLFQRRPWTLFTESWKSLQGRFHVWPHVNWFPCFGSEAVFSEILLFVAQHNCFLFKWLQSPFRPKHVPWQLLFCNIFTLFQVQRLHWTVPFAPDKAGSRRNF